MENPVIAAMESQGMLEQVTSETIDTLLESPGLVVLFFVAAGTHRRETHDVAVALREIIKAYRGRLRAARVDEDAALEERFRVLTAPSLVFCVGRQVQEVLPGVRDWSDYSSAFARYLGPPAPAHQEAIA